MTVGQARMTRLAQAQGQLVKRLEARLAQHERTLAALTAAWSELDGIASSGGSGRLAFLPQTLRSLATAEVAMRDAQIVLNDIRGQLLAAKARHKALDQRAKMLREAWERKSGEEDMLETVLLIAAKASGKHDVVS